MTPRFSASAFLQLSNQFGEPSANKLINDYLTGGLDALNTKIEGPARSLLSYLYLGELESADSVIPEDYIDSLIWRAALAHPRGLSGGYFGHWRYPPEDTHDV